jgi:hypothetical protein
MSKFLQSKVTSAAALEARASQAEAEARELEAEARIAEAEARKVEASSRISEAETRKFVAQTNIVLAEARAKLQASANGFSEDMANALISNMHHVYGLWCTVEGYNVVLRWYPSYPYYNVYLVRDGQLELVSKTMETSCSYRVAPIDRNTNLEFVVSSSHIPNIAVPLTLSDLMEMALQLNTRNICCVSDTISAHVSGLSTSFTTFCNGDGVKVAWGKDHSGSVSVDSGDTWHNTLSPKCTLEPSEWGSCITACRSDSSSDLLFPAAPMSRGNSTILAELNPGLLFYLGCKGGGAAEYVNPSSLGEVVASYGAQLDDDAQLAETDMDVSVLCSNADAELAVLGDHCWLKLELQGWTASLTHYSLKLGTDAKFMDQAPRHWKMQGSIDDVIWVDLDVRTKMEGTFDEPFKVVLFALNSTTEDSTRSFAYFRVLLQCGDDCADSPTPSGLCIANIELYGTLDPTL